MRGHNVIFSAVKCEVLDFDNQLVISGVEEGGLYRVVLQKRAFIANGIDDWTTSMKKV